MARAGERDPDIVEDEAFQRRTWAVQRAGWTAMALIVAAAAGGLLGAGPLARTERADPARTLRLDYSRFERVQTPTRITVHLRASAEGAFALRIGRALADAIQITRMIPDRGAAMRPGLNP